MLFICPFSYGSLINLLQYTQNSLNLNNWCQNQSKISSEVGADSYLDVSADLWITFSTCFNDLHANNLPVRFVFCCPSVELSSLGKTYITFQQLY